MAVLICKNISLEGPGTIEDFLVAGKIPFTVVDLHKGEPIPDSSSYDTLVMMGGPMSVNEEDLYPYINEEERLVREFVSSGRRVLGVCLGAQIMAKALGSKVYRGAEKEIGWYDIELAEEGIRDRAMMRMATHPQAGDIWRRFKVFHWHGETFDIPSGAVRLARSELYPNQAFRYGNNAYAFQFHIEVRKEMVYDWLKDEPLDMERLRQETERLYAVYNARAIHFYEAFFS
ncbi:MAG: type 1 glutamine amidotransferase [Thermodesulfovibrionales bacterium]|jgi:GMP synthase-like glutamine amidotransferase